MSTGLAITGVTPAQFRPNWDSQQVNVNLLATQVDQILVGDSNRVGMVIQNVGNFRIVIRFRSLELSQVGIELLPDIRPLILDFSTLGPIIGDPVFGHASGGASRVFVITASDRGPGRV